MEWLSYNYGGRSEVRAMPLPRSLANVKREISEKKWAEARQWAGGRTSRTKYRMPSGQRPDSMVAGSTKRIASRFYQIKTGHCRTGQYLNWTKSQPTPQCWWCRYPNQTREHLFKVCPEWKAQQKTLWAELWKEAGKWKSRWRIRGLLADGRWPGGAGLPLCHRRGTAGTAEEETVSEVSEAELREWEKELWSEAEEVAVGEEPLLLLTHSFRRPQEMRRSRRPALRRSAGLSSPFPSPPSLRPRYHLSLSSFT